MQNQQAASHIALSIDTYNDIVRYDAAAKNLFKNKKVLAYILKYCAVEFKDCSLEDIEKLYAEKITNFDMLNVIMIRLNSSINTISKLIRLLNVLLSDLPLEERKNILENEYSIPMTVDSKEGNDMCNLGEGIFNRGVQQGTDAESKNGIRKLVQSLQEFNIPESQILEKVMEKYHISQQEALAYLNTIA